jgi:hypothetical protein
MVYGQAYGLKDSSVKKAFIFNRFWREGGGEGGTLRQNTRPQTIAIP